MDCGVGTGREAQSDSMWKNRNNIDQNARCRDCGCPPCMNPKCDTCKQCRQPTCRKENFKEEIQTLNSNYSPKDHAEVLSSCSVNCNAYLCKFCNIRKPRTAFHASVLENAFREARQLLCRNCCSPECANGPLQILQAMPKPKV